MMMMRQATGLSHRQRPFLIIAFVLASYLAAVQGTTLSNLISKGTEGARTRNAAVIDDNTDNPSCVTNLNTIYEAEKNVQDDSILRTYILCPDTEFQVALNFAQDGSPLDGQYPIPVGRPNIHVKCGSDGSSENNCRLVRGLVHVGIVDEFEAGTPAHNTLLQGITFFRATSVNVIAMIPGTIEIRDCIFERNRNVASIYAVLPQGLTRRLSLTSSGQELSEFMGDQRNHNIQRRVQEEEEAQNNNDPSSAGAQQQQQQQQSDLHIQVTKSVFKDNVLGASPGAEATAILFFVDASLEMTDSVVIGTTKDAQKVEEMPNLIHVEGAPVVLEHNCFLGNDEGIAPVIAENNAIVDAKSNFNQRSSSALPNSGCEFIGHNVMTDPSTSKQGYVCEASDASVCTSQRPADYRFPCVSYLDDIYFSEWEVTDASVPRSYLLCPNTVFRVGSRHTDEGTPVGGSYPIILGRANIRVLCGVDGRFENNCQILNGVVQVAHFDEFETGDLPITNALVQGISFSGASSINALVAGKGDVVFRDCVFQNNDNVASVYVQRITPRVRGRRHLTSATTLQQIIQNTPTSSRRTQQSQNDTEVLEATLDSCIFENNTIGSALNPISGLISNFGASLTVTESMFVDTINHASPDYLGYYEIGYLIGNFEGNTRLARNCFFDNSVTIAPVINRQGTLTAMFNAGRQLLAEANQSTALLSERSAKNYGGFLETINGTYGGDETNATAWGPPIDHNLARCEFIADVPSEVLGDVNPELVAFVCHTFDSTECAHPDAPTAAPTLSPTISPQPSAQPSRAPTLQPSVTLPPEPGSNSGAASFETSYLSISTVGFVLWSSIVAVLFV